MNNQKIETAETKRMSASLEPLNIRQIEERLEVSSLAPHGGGMVDSNFFDGDQCCNKCNGNDIEIEMDSPIDTGEILG